MIEVAAAPNVTWKDKHTIIFNEDVNTLLTSFNQPIYHIGYGTDYQNEVTVYLNLLKTAIKTIDNNQTINNLP
jgi:hypothetical protein